MNEWHWMEGVPGASSLEAVVEAIGQGDAAWDAFVAAAPCGHLMQCSAWGALKARFGWEGDRVILKSGEKVVAGAQILYRSVARGLLTLGYVPMGPVVHWDDEAAVRALFSAIEAAARRRGAFCVKLEPTTGADRAGAVNQALRCLPSAHPVQWRSTIEIDLRPTEDELFALLNKRHRQKIRKAAREGVTVRIGQADEVGIFRSLLEVTARRKDFSVYPAEYYQAAYDSFVSGGAGAFLVAEYQGEVLAGIMVFVTGQKAYCFFGATGNVHRELMPAYLLHWEGIRWARALGCQVYDYCGVPDEDESTLEAEFVEREDGLWGVYRFKRGFGGQVVRYADTCDRVLRPVRYWLYDRAVRVLARLWGETWHRRVFPG